MAANHLRRLAAASAPALSCRPQAPSPLLRLALSSSAPADQPAAAEGPAPRKGEAVKEADVAEGAGVRKDAYQEEEEGGGGGAHVNKTTGEIGGPRGPKPTRWERGVFYSDF